METGTSFVRMVLKLTRAVAGSAVYVGIAVLGAGRLDWMRGWFYAAVFVSVAVAGTVIVQLANPGLLDARARGIRQDTKPFDRIFYLMFLPLIVIYPLLTGLDAGHFSFAPLAWWTVYPGTFLFLIGSALTIWTMAVNAHAETTVRIQEDRGHTVIAHGPYRIVRHPMYLGTIIGFPGTALILGSGWSLVPMVLLMVLFVWRTAREDLALQRELVGYGEYAKSTRYRLAPCLW